MGRRKIQIRKIESKDRLKVTFSKRRAGLFKKAQQLSQLSGATVAILVFSPAGKPFTFCSGGGFDETIASFHRDQVPEFTSQPMWWETDLSSQPAGRPFTISSGTNFVETVDSFLGDQAPEFTSQPTWNQVPEYTSQPMWWEADLSSQPAGRPFTFSSGGNFVDTVDSFLGDQVPEFTSQPTWNQVPEFTSQAMWWEADLSRIADLEQLQAYKGSLLKLREKVLERIQRLQHQEM